MNPTRVREDARLLAQARCNPTQLEAWGQLGLPLARALGVEQADTIRAILDGVLGAMMTDQLSAEHTQALVTPALTALQSVAGPPLLRALPEAQAR